MNRVLPWNELCGLMEPFYAKDEGGGHPTAYVTGHESVHDETIVHKVQHLHGEPSPPANRS